MNYKLEITERRVMFANDTKVGDLMRVTNSIYPQYENHILLHHCSGFVSLTNPNFTWTAGCSFQVELVPKGTEIKLIVINNTEENDTKEAKTSQ